MGGMGQRMLWIRLTPAANAVVYVGPTAGHTRVRQHPREKDGRPHHIPQSLDLLCWQDDRDCSLARVECRLCVRLHLLPARARRHFWRYRSSQSVGQARSRPRGGASYTLRRGGHKASSAPLALERLEAARRAPRAPASLRARSRM